MVGILGSEITNQQVADYMEALSVRLNMKQLSKPITYKDTAWMHWETSGVIASWNNKLKNINVEIYTCKAFSPEDAINFTREKLKFTPLSIKNF